MQEPQIMKLFYYSTHHRNFGDALNPYLMERILHIPIKKCNFAKAEMVGVGSLLQKSTAPGYSLFKRVSGVFKPELQVMSSGFIRMIPDNHVLIRKLDVKAVRGYETRRIIEKLTGAPCNAAVGDGGLLYPLLLDTVPEKKYSVGIIPHYCNQGQPMIREIAALHPGAKIIDVLDDPLDVLKNIASCETILSSSLHGLIVADAMNIPNRHVLFSNNVIGDGFKFRDYYSVFDAANVLPSLSAEEAVKMSSDELFGEYISKQARICELQNTLLAAMQD